MILYMILKLESTNFDPIRKYVILDTYMTLFLIGFSQCNTFNCGTN